nr:hypothetical protein [Tanacetum cinerariifolium]
MINDLKKYGYSKDNYELNFKFLNNLQPEWKQYAIMMRQNKNLMDINIDALYNILKQNQGDVNNSMGLKKKTVVVTSDPLALIAEKMKKITALLAKAFNRRNFYSKLTNNNLRTSSASQTANKKQEFIKTDDKKIKKKDDEKKQDMSKVKCYNYHAWMESSSDSDQEINANMVFMAQIEKVLSDSEASSSSADDKISKVSYYLSESESESEYKTLEYYDTTTTYGLIINDNDDQEIFHDCEKFPENLIESQIDQNESAVDHNDSERIDNAFNCNSARMNASVDVNDLFVFDDMSIRKSHVSKMPFRKKPSASLNVPSRSKLNKSLPRIMRKWLPKLQPLAEPIAKWIPRIVQICLWIIDSGCSKHMTGNRALLTNFVEKFFETVRFGNNDFTGIVGYGDVGLEISFRKSTCFVRIKDGVDLLTGDRSSNLYTIALNEVATNSSACLLAKASSSQSWLWHQRLSHLNFTTINKLVKNNLVQSLPKMKFEKDHVCSACEQGKIHRKHHKSKRTFASNKLLYLLHIDLCGPMRVVSINGKRYVLVVVDDYSRRSFHESSESFQEESSSSLLIDDIQKRSEEVGIPSSNTQSVSNNLVPNVDEASTSHNVFNDRLEDAYFDASTLFYDPSNVYTFYQPYPHEKKWTKDHPLHKIIGDPKSSVRTRGQLANSCLFSCLLSSIEPANVVEALRDANWVSAMQEELDQFSRLKVWRLVPRTEGKTIIKTKWIFKNKKDKSSLVIQNKERIVAVGYSQQEGIYYNETFTPVARIEVIRLFLAYAAYKDFTVFQMDVNIAFLNEILNEEVYVGQPLGFVSTQYPDHVYALDKALYGLKQAPRAWYEVLSQFLIDNGFQKGSIDTTLFIKKKGKRIIFGMENCNTVPTPMVEQAKLKLNLVRKPVDHTDYRSMIRSLMYVTSSRPDIMFATCICARYQANPKEHHVSAIKRIFRYLKGTINLGLWYLKDSCFDLTTYSDADHAGCHLDLKTESEYVAVFSCRAQVL